ncbi:MAG: hypothetical protein WC839_01860 [Candidatus Paceibacterota bacterium]
MKFKLKKMGTIALEVSQTWRKVWYKRHQDVMKNRYPKEKDPKIRKNIENAEEDAKEMEQEYGKKNLGPYTDFEWGKLNGRLEGLMWALGNEWGSKY